MLGGRPHRYADLVIRAAVADDTDVMVEMIHDLAEFERSRHSVRIGPSDLRAALFSDHPAVFAQVAELDGEVVGMAIWFLNFSTWTGRHGVYLEDLYVRPTARASGIGRSLVTELATIAVERGYERVEWSVLDWNDSAIQFYRSLGALPMDEWSVYRLSGAALADLGSPANVRSADS
jgi:GNAT superfamily N-acetyltransferase